MSEDPTDIAEVSYIDTWRKDLQVRTSIRTYHAGLVTRAKVNNQTSLHHHLVTAFSQQLVPARGFGPGFRAVLEDFERRTGEIKLRESMLLIDNERVICRVGSFDFTSVAEVVIGDRLTTLVGPEGFLEEPLVSRTLPQHEDQEGLKAPTEVVGLTRSPRSSRIDKRNVKGSLSGRFMGGSNAAVGRFPAGGSDVIRGVGWRQGHCREGGHAGITRARWHRSLAVGLRRSRAV
jgi:hypothetical protein